MLNSTLSPLGSPVQTNEKPDGLHVRDMRKNPLNQTINYSVNLPYIVLEFSHVTSSEDLALPSHLEMGRLCLNSLDSSTFKEIVRTMFNLFNVGKQY